MNIKNIILLFFFVLVNQESFPQIHSIQKPKIYTIGEVHKGVELLSRLECQKAGQNIYYITISGYGYINNYNTAQFTGDQTLADLYNILKSAFSEENKKNKDFGLYFMLGDKFCQVRNFRALGVTSVVFYIESTYCHLTERQVEKLFGK